MEIEKTPLEDCFLIHHRLFSDDRGFFFESFNKERFKENVGLDFDVKQVNFAKSQKNVLRGLHYQLDPYSQGKLVGVVQGVVFDVAIDIRKNSPTFGKSFSILLDKPDVSVLVPKGFAHGYEVLSDETIFYYAVDNFYAPDHERGILYNDPALDIQWNNSNNTVSDKDKGHPLLKDAEVNFEIKR